MMPLVVDASVVFKWFLPEPGSDKARELLDGTFALIAPDLLWSEVANVLWKMHRRKALSRLDAETLLMDVELYNVALHPSRPLLIPAFRLATEHDRTVYDSLYIALALRENATLITSDSRLVNALAHSPLAGRAVLLADF